MWILKIMEQMPPAGSKPFTQVTIREFVISEIKKKAKIVCNLIYKS